MAPFAQEIWPKTATRQTIDDVCQQRDAASGRQRGRDQSQKSHDGDYDQDFTRHNRHRISEEHQASADKYHQHDRKVVEQVVDDQRGHAMHQRHAFSEQRNFRSFAEQWPGKREEAHRLAAEPRREGLKESEAALLWRNGSAHRDRAQHVTQSVHGYNQEETKADAAERGEDWLYADRADYIDEQQRAEHEGQSLRPGHGAPGARRPADRVRLGRFDQRVIVETFLGNQNLKPTAPERPVLV